MSLAVQRAPLATVEDLLAIPEEERFHEIIDGELVRKAMPTPKHGGAQIRFGELMRPYNRRPGGRWPGGWWFASEVEVAFDKAQVFRPDVAGWRRERLAELPDVSPIAVRPDWICEILSTSNKRDDLIKQKRVYRRYEVPHYWIIDPASETLSVYRWTAQGDLEVLLADRHERIKAEPFLAVEFSVGFLFGEDDDEG
jgi:Uma2 family endonuclease